MKDGIKKVLPWRGAPWEEKDVLSDALTARDAKDHARADSGGRSLELSGCVDGVTHQRGARAWAAHPWVFLSTDGQGAIQEAGADVAHLCALLSAEV